MSVKIIQGDCCDVMRQMIADRVQVDCVVTSPPYWGLRDYGIDGQIGLERSLAQHLEKMIEVFSLVRQIMKPEATLWLNYGDCYATTPNGKSAAEYKADGSDDRTFRDKPFSTIGPIYTPDQRDTDRRGNHSTLQGSMPVHTPGRISASGYLKPKDLCMIPNRLAIALQDDGWWVRSEIIWHKPNPMPESVSDRPATAHEKIFLLSKSSRYFYDAEAVRRPHADSTAKDSRLNKEDYKPCRPERGYPGHASQGGGLLVRKDKQRGHGRRHAGFNDRWDSMPKDEQIAGGATLKNVWTIATKPFKESHFATFPPELAETCIKAGCPKGGTVFDPFGGAGTTGLVADRLQRNAILIELNPDYIDIAKRRIHDDAPMFTEVVK